MTNDIHTQNVEQTSGARPARDRSARTGVTRGYWIHAITPLHVGTGRGIGFIDLPLMREAVTNWPFIPGSTVKGVLADYYGVPSSTRVGDDLAAFGGGGDYAKAGALVFTDARLVCLPIRSLYGTFAWCTCPMALYRWVRDAGGTGTPWPDLPVPEGEVWTPTPTPGLAMPSSLVEPNGGKVYLEDLDFDVRADQRVSVYADAIGPAVFADPRWRHLFRHRFAVVHDDVFGALCVTATQVDARVKIDDDKKTVTGGALWYEESLPAETLLTGFAWCAPTAGGNSQTLLNTYCSGTLALQIGGKASVGRGQADLIFGAPSPNKEA